MSAFLLREIDEAFVPATCPEAQNGGPNNKKHLTLPTGHRSQAVHINTQLPDRSDSVNTSSQQWKWCWVFWDSPQPLFCQVRGSASEVGREELDKKWLVHPQRTGVAAVTVSISAYSATGELDIRRTPFTLGTRVFLTCDVTGLPEGSEVLSYMWYHNCREIPNSRCEIRDSNPYYRVVKDTLLVDVTSLDQGGRYYCTVQHQQDTEMAITRKLAVAG